LRWCRRWRGYGCTDERTQLGEDLAELLLGHAGFDELAELGVDQIVCGGHGEDSTYLLEDIDVSLGRGVVRAGLEDALLLAERKLELADDLRCGD